MESSQIIIADNSTVTSHGSKLLYGEEGAALYICIIILTFAMAIVFTIIAQMSYQPENQVTSYLKQRSILRDRIILHYYLQKKEKRQSMKSNGSQDETARRRSLLKKKRRQASLPSSTCTVTLNGMPSLTSQQQYRRCNSDYHERLYRDINLQL
ncbi:hypothetical protein EB796_001694 [Bugula neritina]|uniref:Uncharacterized protein n=1 Tax=Bugula neritina TaxID=10212 RepID=A0A7J7KPB9_BUGNE|nr:hypothetical protein EB796_001694 [Bugula neritina]